LGAGELQKIASQNQKFSSIVTFEGHVVSV
jgi:hypothetical protein